MAQKVIITGRNQGELDAAKKLLPALIAIKSEKIKTGYVLCGRTIFDHETGSMIFIKPRQVVEMRNWNVHAPCLQGSMKAHVLPPQSMFDITDAIESRRTIMLALNREWIKKQGDFFVEFRINFVTAFFGYLKKTETESIVPCRIPSSLPYV